MELAALKTPQLLTVVIPAGALALAVFKLWLDARTERQRTQPIVIAHEKRERHFPSDPNDTDWEADAYLTSEGERAAFNVTFGVELGGVRFPFKMGRGDAKANRQRVIRPGDRLPEKGTWRIRIDSLTMYGIAARGELDPGIYWCRYENAAGKTYETRNPGDRMADLDIRRVRWIKRVPARLWGESFRRWRASRRGMKLDAGARNELREGMKQRVSDSTDSGS